MRWFLWALQSRLLLLLPPVTTSLLLPLPPVTTVLLLPAGFSAQSVFFPLYIATFNAVWAAYPTLGYGLFEQVGGWVGLTRFLVWCVCLSPEHL